MDAVAALLAVVWFGGEHADVLGEAGLGAGVAGVAVGEGGVPDDEVAGVGFDFDGRRDVAGEALVELLVAEVIVGEAVFGGPLGDPVVDAGDALEAAFAGAGVDEVEDALDEQRQRLLADVHVPVDHALVVVFGVRGIGRRLEVGAVEEDPEVVAVEELAEEVVDGRVLADVPEGLVVVHLDHAVDAVGFPVPAGRVVAVELEEAPDGVDNGLDHQLRDEIGDDEVALLLEEGLLLAGQHLGFLVESGMCAGQGSGLGIRGDDDDLGVSDQAGVL